MKAISSMATRHVLAELTAAAAASGLSSVDVESVGGVEAARRVAGGERLDLVFLASDALSRLAVDGYVEAASLRPLVVSQVAVAVPSDAGEPAQRPEQAAFADAAGVRAALRRASRIGYSTGPSGDALVQAIQNWALTEEIGGRLVQARPGLPVARLLADGEADLGFQQLSELVGQPGIRILGILPPDCEIVTVFSGAVATTATDPASARKVLEFLASTAAARIKAAHNFEAPRGRTNYGRDRSQHPLVQ